MEELIADEDIPRPIVQKLRDKDLDILYIEEEAKGCSDTEVLEISRDEQRPILTFDNDFFQFEGRPGILHITSRTNYDTVVEAVEEVVKHLKKNDSENAVIRINPSKYSG